MVTITMVFVTPALPRSPVQSRPYGKDYKLAKDFSHAYCERLRQSCERARRRQMQQGDEAFACERYRQGCF